MTLFNNLNRQSVVYYYAIPRVQVSKYTRYYCDETGEINRLNAIFVTGRERIYFIIIVYL